MNDSLSTSTAKKIEIITLLNQFGIAIDSRDWNTFGSLFADEVEFDYSAIGDIAGVFKSQEIAQNARKNFSGFQATQHLITNHQIELASTNEANCKAYVRAMHVLPNDEVEPMLEIGGCYIAKLIETDSHWKITSWKFELFWSQGDFALFELAKNDR